MKPAETTAVRIAALEQQLLVAVLRRDHQARRAARAEITHLEARREPTPVEAPPTAAVCSSAEASRPAVA